MSTLTSMSAIRTSASGLSRRCCGFAVAEHWGSCCHRAMVSGTACTSASIAGPKPGYGRGCCGISPRTAIWKRSCGTRLLSEPRLVRPEVKGERASAFRAQQGRFYPQAALMHGCAGQSPTGFADRGSAARNHPSLRAAAGVRSEVGPG